MGKNLKRFDQPYCSLAYLEWVVWSSLHMDVTASRLTNNKKFNTWFLGVLGQLKTTFPSCWISGNQLFGSPGLEVLLYWSLLWYECPVTYPRKCSNCESHSINGPWVWHLKIKREHYTEAKNVLEKTFTHGTRSMFKPIWSFRKGAIPRGPLLYWKTLPWKQYNSSCIFKNIKFWWAVIWSKCHSVGSLEAGPRPQWNLKWKYQYEIENLAF